MEHTFISKRYWNLKPTPMGGVDEAVYQFDNIINLSLGDPDLTTDERVIEKAFADAKAGHTHYTDFRGDPELRAEIAKFYAEEYQMQVDDSEIFVSTSACLAMELVLEAILNDGEEVILQAPYFTPYRQQVILARGVPVELPTYEEEDFQINMERLEQAITERTKALVINTPNNPTGSCLELATLERIAEIAKKHDLLVIADDIYTSFSYQHPFIPIASLPGMRERTVTINSVSKNYIMTGWRVGNIIAPDFIISTIQAVNENMAFTAPSVSQRAAIHAMRMRKLIQPAMLEEYRKRVFYAAERINEIANMSVPYPPKGTFYLFVNIKKTGLTSQEVCDLLLSEAQILAIPGNAFGACGEGYIRLACTVGTEVLEEAFDRIAKMEIFQR